MVALILEGARANTNLRQSLDPSTRVGDLSIVERAALAARRAGVDRCVVVGRTRPLEAVTARLRARGANVSFVDWGALRLLDLSDGALVIRDDVLVEPRALVALLDCSNASDGHTVLVAGGTETDPDLVVLPPDNVSILDEVTSQLEFLLQLARVPLRRQVSLGPLFCRRLGAGSDLARAEIDYIRHQNGGASESFFTKRIRRFSVPLSRALVRRGATPTQVTLAGLVLAIASATAVSVGTYVASLFGAVLYYASMVLDCSDGEVARLSFRDSAFGAWLETIVDYTSYFLLLGGLVLGSRQRESADLYQQAAFVALAGSILIAAVAGYLRHRVAGAAPGEFDDASAAALAKASPFHRFARWGRQWIKRSTIAHLVVTLALVNQLPFLIYLWAFGAVVGSVIILGVEPFIVQRVKVEALPKEESDMVPVRAIILAAGSGSRLRPYTADRPKCLLEIDGRTLIEHQIDSLGKCGVSDVVVVVGYCANVVRRVIGNRVRYIESVRYRETNSLYSLWEARDELDRGAVVINSDVLAAPLLFERLCSAAAPDAVLIDRDQTCDVEEMRVAIEGDLVVDFGKDLPPERSHGENVGMIKFGAAAAPRLRMCLERLVASGHEGAWSPLAFRELAREWPLHVVATDGLPWIEIDYPEDLERARRDIAPAMLTREVAAPLA